MELFFCEGEFIGIADDADGYGVKGIIRDDFVVIIDPVGVLLLLFHVNPILFRFLMGFFCFLLIDGEMGSGRGD